VPKSYAGQSAHVINFSHDGRYLAYIWNPFGEVGLDLYLYDTQTGETRRITSLR
jgi:Tol biopolymer transport system component